MTLSIIPIPDIAEVGAGDEIADLILDAARDNGITLADRDCVVVTQKIVSKAENRMVPLDPDDLEARAALVESESVRIVRRRGDLIISETSHGFVCANAGIDLSNVAEGWATLLPVDADRSAKHIHDALRARAGVEIAVVISDTFGRPWRRGLTDVAIGVCSLAAVLDLRDTPDALGRTLKVTEVAIADEVASAAELVMGKSLGIPAAIVRGLDGAWFRDGSVRELIRPKDEDLFSVIPQFLEARRSIRAFTDDAVPRDVLDALVAAACIAAAPHHSRPWRFAIVDTDDAKHALAQGMGARWRADLMGDGVTPARVDELVDASYTKITGAPALVLGCLTWDGLDRYPDERRQRAEWGMALLSLGAAVENLMLAAADDLASCWIAAPIFCPEEARDALALPGDWLPHAMVMVGTPDPAYTGRVRPPVPLEDLRKFPGRL